MESRQPKRTRSFSNRRTLQPKQGTLCASWDNGPVRCVYRLPISLFDVLTSMRNCVADQRDQFKKYVTNTMNLSYDYNSIMHYGWNYFAVDITKPTILPNVKGAAIGSRTAMSPTDVEKINRQYSCPQSIQNRPQIPIPSQWLAVQAVPVAPVVPGSVTPAPSAGSPG